MSDNATLGDLIDAADSASGAPPEAQAAARALRDIDLATLMGQQPPTPLGGLIDDLMSQAANHRLLADHKLAREPLSWSQLSNKWGLATETARQAVTHDINLIRDLLQSDQFRVVGWAAEQMRSDLGVLAPGDSVAVRRWRSRLDDSQFQALRWLARYVYDDGWLIQDTAASKGSVVRSLDEAAGDEWLVRADDLIVSVEGLRLDAGHEPPREGIETENGKPCHSPPDLRLCDGISANVFALRHTAGRCGRYRAHPTQRSVAL